MTKLTKKVALSYAIAALTNSEINSEFTAEDVVAKLNEMIESLDKKSGGEKKPTEQQIANTGFKNDILVLLSDKKPRTATEILNEVPTFPDVMTNQRVSQLLRQLKLNGNIDTDVVKGKRLFFIKDGD